MPVENLTTEQFAGRAKKLALELEQLSLTDHTCLVNVLMRLCERRQALYLEQVNTNTERQQREAQHAPHLITKQ
jgi:hypothetical protein